MTQEVEVLHRRMISQQQLTRILNAKPEKQTAFVYQAIVLSLAGHILVLALIYLSGSPSMGNTKDEPDETVKELELAFEEEEPEEIQEELPDNMSEEVRNLLANSQSEKTKERVNYSRKSKAQIEEEVRQELEALENEEKRKLAERRPEKPKENLPPSKPDKKPDKNSPDNVPNPSDKSYEGRVAALYSLENRSAINQPKPLYRCKSSGRVIVKIEVDQTGKVIAATIDDSGSVMNDCLRQESQKYAMKWKFDYSTAAPKKQNGTITFDFSAQK